MKKRILMVTAACAAVCVLGACNHKPNGYDAINKMLHADYSKIVITVTDTFDESLSLSSEYTIRYFGDGMTVSYSVEKLAPVSDTSWTEMKTTYTGEVTFQGGVIVSKSGDEIDLEATDLAMTGLSFKEEYFENAELTGVYLKADVKDVSGFFGSELACTDMRVEATFLEALYEISVSYTSAVGSAVECQYIFTL